MPDIEHDLSFALAVQSSGLRIEASDWSTTGRERPDLIEFSFVGARGAVKAQTAMTTEAAEFYWRKLGRLLGKDVERPISAVTSPCDCMPEPDPLGGPDKVLTHSADCPEHPDDAR